MRGGGRGRGVSTTMMTKSHHHHYSSPYTTTTTTATAATDSWAHHRNHQDQDQYMIDGSGGGGGGGWGLSWPPRYYTCNFCKREFRSAQALGGHMNVHRRDRARLRVQSPKLLAPISPNYSPNLNLNLIPNPNPNPTAPTLPSPSAPNHDVVDHLLPRYRKQVGPAIFDPKKLLVMRRPMSLSGKTSRGRGVVKLGLEIGIFDGDGDDEDDQEEDVEVGVDLELRLGYKH